MTLARALQLPLIDAPVRRRARLRPVDAGARPPVPSTEVRRRPQAWLALRFVDLPLMAAMNEPAIDGAIAVVDDDRQRRVMVCNAAAASCGIRPGHSFNAAIALNADVVLLNRHADREDALLKELAIFCNHYSPVVTIASDVELLVEVRGSLRLFGGVTSFLDRLRADFSTRGLHPQIALSPTAQASLWSARCARVGEACVVTPKRLSQVLATLPLAALHWPAQVNQRLQRFGLTTLGELLRMPRDGLTKRIGSELVLELDQARGRAAAVHRVVSAPLVYADHMHLDFEVETAGLLERMLEPRLDRLKRFLQRRAVAVREIEVRLVHRAAPPSSIHVTLASATSDTERMRRLLKEKLHAYQLIAPVRQASVIVQHFESQAGESHALLPDPAHSTELLTQAKAKLLEQLDIRLGAVAVRQPRHYSDRRPERAATCGRPVFSLSTPALPVPPEIAPRPLWLSPAPTPWRRPATCTVVRGPERIRAGWWDEAAVDRSYYVVQVDAGTMLWVFHDHASGGWFKHGVFA